jgi:sugar phosphate permease
MTGTDADRRRLRWKLITLAAMYGGYAAFMLCRNTLIASSAAFIEDPELGFDVGTYGRLMSWHSAGAILGKLTLGLFADRLGGRVMFLACLAVTALSTVAFGWVSAFYLFAMLNFTGQFFKSGGWPAMAKIIGDWYPSQNHGRVWAIVSTSSRVGTFSAGLLVGGLLLVMSWRTAFLTTGSIAAWVFVVLWFTLKSKPSDVGVAPPSPTPEEDTAPRAAHALDGTTLGQACLCFLNNPRVWLICFAMAFLTILMDFLVFIPVYLSQSLHLEAAQSAMAGSTFPIGMFVALIACGVYYDRVPKDRLIYVLGGLLVLACGCVGLLWLLPSLPVPEASHVPIAIAAIFVFGFAVSPAYYLPMSLFSISFGGIHSGFLIALIDVFGYLGSWVFNFFGGQIAQDHGWPVFLAMLLAINVLALVTMGGFLRLDGTRTYTPTPA